MLFHHSLCIVRRQILRFKPQVLKKQLCRSHGKRGEGSVVDLTIGDDQQFPKQLFHRACVLGLIEASLKPGLFFQLFGRKRRVLFEQLEQS